MRRTTLELYDFATYCAFMYLHSPRPVRFVHPWLSLYLSDVTDRIKLAVC